MALVRGYRVARAPVNQGPEEETATIRASHVEANVWNQAFSGGCRPDAPGARWDQAHLRGG